MKKFKFGGGFLLIVISYSFSFVFFSWGFSKPDLERVWEIYHEVKIGKIKSLTEKDKLILTKNLKKHSSLEEEFLKNKKFKFINSKLFNTTLNYKVVNEVK